MRSNFGWTAGLMLRISLLAASTAVLGLAAGCGPAAAQFGGLFGGPPPRPPSSVPTSPPPPPPQPYPQQQPSSQNNDPFAPIQSQSLPPPGGTASGDPRFQQGTFAPSPQPNGPPPVAGLPPGQRPQLRGSAPAAVAPQGEDETITELPSQKIPNPTAVFAGLDKITGRIISFDVAINETVQFGALQVTPRVCYTRPPTEASNTDGFIEVNEVTLQGEVKRIFTGWMFAASPGLHAVEHPIYDVWLTDCKGAPSTVAVVQPTPQPNRANPNTKPPARQAKPVQPSALPPPTLR
jgi:hypothetical protein